MQILSKGFKLPDTGDFGDDWFPALEDNITQLNSHDHDGVDSAVISPLSMTAYSASVLSGAFVDNGDGYWRQLLTVPGGLAVDSFSTLFRDPTTKDPVHLKIEKVSATTYYVYTNFVQTFEVLYLV